MLKKSLYLVAFVVIFFSQNAIAAQHINSYDSLKFYDQTVLLETYKVSYLHTSAAGYIQARSLGEVLGKNYKWYAKEKAFVISANNTFACIVPEQKKVIIKDGDGVSITPLSSTINSGTLFLPIAVIHNLKLSYKESASVYDVYLSAWQHVYEKQLDAFLQEINHQLQSKPVVLAQYTTRFNAGNVNRTSNIKLASKTIDGVVLGPSEFFSFNKIVGRRTPQAGYKKAIVFVNKEKVEDYGGGICQVSSTLYNAVYKAQLKVIERRSHSLDVTYVPKGMDATVSYGHIDFVFKNNKDFAIALKSKVDKNKITVSVIKF